MQGLEDIPTWFADTWNISLEAAQVLLSIVILIAVLLPVMYFARGTRAVMIEIVMFFLIEAMLVGIGWLPFWIMIATVAVMAIAVAMIGTKVVTGG